MLDAIYNLLGRIGYHHPIHPSEVHMPIGLIFGAFIFGVLAMLFRRRKVIPTPMHCMILALIWLFPTMLFGIMDWQHFYAGAWILPIKVKLITTPILIVLLGLGIFLAHKYGTASVRVLPVYFLCVCAVVILGYFGGQLTFGGRTIEGPKQYRTGQHIYAVNCTACHPGGGNALQPDKPLLHSPLLATPQTFRMWLSHPAAPMPAFPESSLPPEKTQALYDYITHVVNK